jgi:hypothetical protein
MDDFIIHNNDEIALMPQTGKIVRNANLAIKAI